MSPHPTIRGGLLLVAVLTLAACASPDATTGPAAVSPPAGGTPVTTGTTTDPATPAQNEAAARAEADRLATGAVLPPGAVAVADQPDGLDAPALGTPVTSQLVVITRYHTVPMPLAQTQAWFQTHPQPDLTSSGTSDSSGGPGGRVVHGFGYTSPATSSWGHADLAISITTDGSDTAIRVDGTAQWIDPTPVRDPVTGPTLRLSVSDDCPASDEDLHDVDNPDAPDLDDRMVPDAAPTEALTCVYDGMNGHPYTLTDSRRLDAAQAAGLADHLRSLPLGSWGDGPHSCPMADGRATITVFGYDGRADVDIWQWTSGCSATANGHIIATGT